VDVEAAAEEEAQVVTALMRTGSLIVPKHA
jgi:hypothetical protein